MSSLVVVPPAPLAQAGTPRLFTPDPKEAVTISAGGSTTVALDLGAAFTSIDSLYIGYYYGNTGAAALYQSASYGGANGALAMPTLGLSPLGLGQPFHSFARFTAVASRYYNLQLAAGASPLTIGVVAIGQSFQPSLGHEYGSGRFVTDTGSVERLKSGAFGVDEGVTAGGWQWTMGDLTDLEIRQLYQVARNRGASRTVLVVEDPDQTDGLNERIHWGILDKLDPYERFAPGANRWAMKINDWV